MTLILLSAFLLLLPLPASAEVCAPGPLTGKVTYVRIAGKIELNGFFPIQLEGMVAPDWGEPGAPQSANAMRNMVLGKWVKCELDGSQTYDRCVAVCRLNGADIAEALVQMGRARDCPRYSGGRYRKAEIEAAKQGATIRAIYELPEYCQER
jgi:endonuclease YncB( thermonuclease family)